MNRKEFIKILGMELSKNRVDDVEEIISEFEEHFDYKLEEGKSEEEIVRKIGNPVDIASDYSKLDKPKKNKGRFIKALGLVFADMIMIPIYMVLWICIIILPVLAITLGVLGTCLLTTMNVASLIPEMPYICALVIGVSVLALALMSAIGSFYVYRYVKQWTKVYFRWHKNVMNNFIYPSLSMHPRFSKKISAGLKLLNMISTLVFIATFTIGYLICTLMAGSFEFWHVWEWFV